MDPNEALRLARDHANTLLNEELSGFDAVGLAEAFRALDEWLTNGGFLPAAWTPQPSPATNDANGSS